MDGDILMSKNSILRFQVVSDFLNNKLTRLEAAEQLDVSERTISRLAGKVEKKGLAGFIHGNKGRSPPNKYPDELCSLVMKLVNEKYYDFNMFHCLEELRKELELKISYATFRKWCHFEQMVKHKYTTKRTRRTLRDRRRCEGMLLQMDGSPDYWVNGRKSTLIGMIDDATSEIGFAKLFKSETTLNCLEVLQEVILRKGIPMAIYTDKAGWAGGSKRVQFTQFKRACDELGIRLIFANSPEAKGRIERAWRTFQDRLIPELRVNGIINIKTANNYILNHFLPEYWNKRNTVIAKSPENKYREVSREINLEDILCLKEYRKIQRNETFSFEGVTYKITSKILGALKGREVEIRTYNTGKWIIYIGNRQLNVKKAYIPIRQLVKRLSA